MDEKNLKVLSSLLFWVFYILKNWIWYDVLQFHSTFKFLIELRYRKNFHNGNRQWSYQRKVTKRWVLKNEDNAFLSPDLLGTFLIKRESNLIPWVHMFSCFRHRHYEDENEWGCGSWLEYAVVLVLASILLLGSLALTLFWVMQYHGGFAWREDPGKQFNLHPVLMVAGFITFSGFCKYQIQLPNLMK